MVSVGDVAPDFTLPLAGGDAYNDVESFTLSRAPGSGPTVLAFFPAAFTRGCTAEMCSFRDSLDAYRDLDARVFGISVDLPFAQNVWIQENGLDFPLLSDWEHTVIRRYDVVREGMYDLVEVARRSVFVLDPADVVTYTWVRQGDNPDFDAFVSDLRDEVARAAV
ncbi:MAG: redoxin domain-containing protein [Halanaeroarchaeum sp.]